MQHNKYRIKNYGLVAIMIFMIVSVSSVIYLTPVYSDDDYIFNSGFLGAITINNSLVELKAGHQYYFTVRSTESVSFIALKIAIWEYDTTSQFYDYNYTENGIFYNVAHVDFSIYEAIGSHVVSQSNPLIKIWGEKVEITNTTLPFEEYLIHPRDYLGNKVTSKSNSIIAIGMSPSIDIIVNASDTVYTLYEETVESDMILTLLESLNLPIAMNIGWEAEKGSISENINNPSTISVYEPSTIVSAFAIEFGFPYDAVGIAFFSLFLLSGLFAMYNRGIDVSSFSFGGIAIFLGIIFGILGVIPLWFAVPLYLLCIGLLASNMGNNSSEI